MKNVTIKQLNTAENEWFSKGLKISKKPKKNCIKNSSPLENKRINLRIANTDKYTIQLLENQNPYTLRKNLKKMKMTCERNGLLPRKH